MGKWIFWREFREFSLFLSHALKLSIFLFLAISFLSRSAILSFLSNKRENSNLREKFDSNIALRKIFYFSPCETTIFLIFFSAHGMEFDHLFQYQNTFKVLSNSDNRIDKLLQKDLFIFHTIPLVLLQTAQANIIKLNFQQNESLRGWNC